MSPHTDGQFRDFNDVVVEEFDDAGDFVATWFVGSFDGTREAAVPWHHGLDFFVPEETTQIVDDVLRIEIGDLAAPTCCQNGIS